MKNIPLEIVIPVFNEGEKILKLMDLFQKNIKTKFRVLFCYDLENDNLFNYKNELTKFDFEILFFVRKNLKMFSKKNPKIFCLETVLFRKNILAYVNSKFLQDSKNHT